MSVQHDLELAVQRVRDLHQPASEKNNYGVIVCLGCQVNDDFYSPEYPCPTIKALEGNHES